jgi:hypothetical protein
MQIKLSEDNNTHNMAYLDPIVVNSTTVVSMSHHMEDYLVEFLYTFQRKEYIFLSYNFRYIFDYTIILYYVSLIFYNLRIIDCNEICIGFTRSVLSLI